VSPRGPSVSVSLPSRSLVPGACHGGGCFDDLASGLRSRGHQVLALTLTGVAERAHLLHAGVNLETHIADILAELAVHRAKDTVLVGHSYGGMVITAVADRLPHQVDSLVYLDALVPHDGESCWALVNDVERQWYLGVDETGYGVPPMPFFDPRATAHSLASFLQPIKLTGRSQPIPPTRLRVCAEMAGRFTAPAIIRTGSRRPELDHS
jgi:pimeloyl-ACP methyl ester carboxylesterase